MEIKVSGDSDLVTETPVTVGEDVITVHASFLNEIKDTVINFQLSALDQLCEQGAVTGEAEAHMRVFLNMCLKEGTIQLNDVFLPR